MNRCFTTTVDDNYQELIPLYALAIKSWSEDDVVIFCRCEPLKWVADIVGAIGVGGGITLIHNYAADYPNVPSVTAAIRFQEGEEYLSGYDYVMVTDIDLLPLVDPWDYYIPRITVRQPYCGHHGAWSRPLRPKICSSWTGEYERVSGGLFCISNGWWDKTREQRMVQSSIIKSSETAHYREEDEVYLGRIIKASGMRVPASGSFPHDYRGVHLGDFKFDHRWKSMVTMKNLLTDNVCRKFINLCRDPMYKDAVGKISNKEIIDMIKNANTHIRERF